MLIDRPVRHGRQAFHEAADYLFARVADEGDGRLFMLHPVGNDQLTPLVGCDGTLLFRLRDDLASEAAWYFMQQLNDLLGRVEMVWFPPAPPDRPTFPSATSHLRLVA